MERPRFINPEVARDITPRLTGIEPDNGTLRRAIQIKNAVVATSESLGMQPFSVVKEIRLANASAPDQARAIEKERVEKFAYVGDIHGFTPQKQAEIEEPLLTGNFDQIFFTGDIGGSDLLAKLQKLFYQGGNTGNVSLMWNRYKQLAQQAQQNGDQISDEVMLTELREGYLNIASFEKTLIDQSLSEEKAREQVVEMSDVEIVADIKRIVSHVHFGHYVADLPEEAIDRLAQDVRGNYERFADFVGAIKDQTGADVFVAEGNWDARLPFDFRRGTEKPEPLPIKERRFYGADILRAKGVSFITEPTIVASDTALHLVLPFDSLAKPADPDLVKTLFLDAASKAGRREVLTVGHAVLSWDAHGNTTPTKEGETTTANFRDWIQIFRPSQAITGHEHFPLKDRDGNNAPNIKYGIKIDSSGEADVAPYLSPDVLNSIDDIRVELAREREATSFEIAVPTIVSPVPMSDQLTGSRIAHTELLRDLGPQQNRNEIRGRGGKASPVRVDLPVNNIS